MTYERRTSERRILARSPVFHWRGRKGTHEGRFHDVSSGGCFVATPGVAQPGETVSLELLNPAGDVVRFSGTVVHSATVETRGFGMKFTSMSGNARAYLRLIRPVRRL